MADKKEHHSKVQKAGMTLIMNKDFHYIYNVTVDYTTRPLQGIHNNVTIPTL